MPFILIRHFTKARLKEKEILVKSQIVIGKIFARLFCLQKTIMQKKSRLPLLNIGIILRGVAANMLRPQGSQPEESFQISIEQIYKVLENSSLK